MAAVNRIFFRIFPDIKRISKTLLELTESFPHKLLH